MKSCGVTVEVVFLHFTKWHLEIWLAKLKCFLIWWHNILKFADECKGLTYEDKNKRASEKWKLQTKEEKEKYENSAKAFKELDVKVSELSEEQRKKIIERHRKKLLEEVIITVMLLFTYIRGCFIVVLSWAKVYIVHSLFFRYVYINSKYFFVLWPLLLMALKRVVQCHLLVSEQLTN